MSFIYHRKVAGYKGYYLIYVFISPITLRRSLKNVVPSHYKVQQKQTNPAQLDLRSQSALLKCQQADKQWKNLGGRV